jgi:chemotaxis protein methyltransferase CheR
MILETGLERLKRAVVEKTGHHYYVDKDKLLLERVHDRMRMRGVTSLNRYLEILDADAGSEWRALEDAITIGETYFFRYPDHFHALRTKVLPDLIARRADTRALRIWSIGCANGAEPYSLAILLREVLGDQVDSWRIALIGGDISEKALSAARNARYGAWALRTMPPDDRTKYFHRDGAAWVLKREYRSMARFERQNILDLLARTAPIEWNGFDLILCRNVLIYFSPHQALEIMEALKHRLASDGTLVLGHAEAILATNPGLLEAQGTPTEFGQALVPAAAPLPAYFPPVVPPLPLSMAPQPAKGPQASLPDAQEIEHVQLLADAGAYEQAERLCRELIARDPTSARLQYYDAVLRQVSDDPAGAEAALKRALYLDRGFTLAHHRLGMLMLGAGRIPEARRSLLTAARLAEAAPESAPLPEGQGVSAGVFGAMLREQLEALGDEAA